MKKFCLICNVKQSSYERKAFILIIHSKPSAYDSHMIILNSTSNEILNARTESLLRKITFLQYREYPKEEVKVHIYLFYSRDFSYGYYIQSCCQANNSHFWRRMDFWLQNAHLPGHYVVDERVALEHMVSFSCVQPCILDQCVWILQQLLR